MLQGNGCGYCLNRLCPRRASWVFVFKCRPVFIPFTFPFSRVEMRLIKACMSWQRILRFARQRQVPVIVTDESGEDPMILLSLDQLEQALDGNIGPDLPPPPPAPRATTPSFVPDISSPEPELVQTSTPASEPILRPSEEIFVPEIATPSMAEEVPAPVPEEKKPTFFVDEPVKGESVPEGLPAPEPEIITPNMPPVPQELAIPEPVAVPVASPVQPVPAQDLSLEERFFLDF